MAYTIDDVIKPVQKSTVFLYPLLALPSNIKPINTFLNFDNVLEQNKFQLIVLFNNQNNKYIELKQAIINHKLFDYELNDDCFDIIVFDLKKFYLDFNKVVEGKYSKLSTGAKSTLLYNNPTCKIYEYVFNPENHYLTFSNLFQCSVESMSGNELCSPPDILSETLSINEEVKNQLKELICYP